MEIGKKLKQLRIKNNLTQEELAARSELSKGFISQVERDLTSISIATLIDVLECLGTNLKDFFNETEAEKIVFARDDYFVKENYEMGHQVQWIVPNSQKNDMEPILLTLPAGGKSWPEDPHAGEEFGFCLAGNITLHIGQRRYKMKKGESFYFVPSQPHYVENTGKVSAQLLWVVTPPTF